MIETKSRNFVTVVSGLPRSGTSLMMQMIDHGGIPALTDAVRRADEDNPRGYYEFEAVKQTKKDASWLRNANGKVVKMVHLLLLDLPADHKYRVVFMRRELKEVIKSQNIMLERNKKQTGDLPDEKVMQVFRLQLDKVLGWVRSQPNFKLLEVDYNKLVGDPEPTARTIDDFLGGGLGIQGMVDAVDPSLYRNRGG